MYQVSYTLNGITKVETFITEFGAKVHMLFALLGGASKNFKIKAL